MRPHVYLFSTENSAGANQNPAGNTPTNGLGLRISNRTPRSYLRHSRRENIVMVQVISRKVSFRLLHLVTMSTVRPFSH